MVERSELPREAKDLGYDPQDAAVQQVCNAMTLRLDDVLTDTDVDAHIALLVKKMKTATRSCEGSNSIKKTANAINTPENGGEKAERISYGSRRDPTMCLAQSRRPSCTIRTVYTTRTAPSARNSSGYS